MRSEDALQVWTIYEHPVDFPEGFVTRRTFASTAGIRLDAKAFRCATLEQARAVVPQGLHRMPRQPDDDPAIAEVWF